MKDSKKLLLWAGIIICLSVSLDYFYHGFSKSGFFVWLASLALIAFSFHRQHKAYNFRKDIMWLLLLLLIFAPIYLTFNYQIPYQVNTDEVVIMTFAEKELTRSNPDWFGLSEYFGFPAMVFVFFGFLSKLIGGIDLAHFRIVHASIALIIIVLSYGFFRLLLNRPHAFLAALLVGGSHALLGISRMAMRDNSGLMLELLSLLFLFVGLKFRSYFYTFLGGCFAGLTFYGYFPGRITVFIWAVFMIVLMLIALMHKHRAEFRQLLKLSFLSAFAFFLVALPVLIATTKTQTSTDFAKSQLLIYKEGREMQQNWIHAQSEQDGVVTNIIRGLTVFNNKVSDHGWIYPNLNFGFADPVSGAAVWIGFAYIIYSLLKKKEHDEAKWLMLSGFATLMITFSFVVNKAPNFTRLLVILPFYAYLALQGFKFLAAYISKLIKKWKEHYDIPSAGIVTVLCLITLGFNLYMFGDFVSLGLKDGHEVGSTGRYVEARKDLNDHKFYLAADSAYPYYYWGETFQWEDWIEFFALPNQEVKVLLPPTYLSSLSNESSTVFMSGRLWADTGWELLKKFPQARIHYMKTDGSLLAIEIQP